MAERLVKVATVEDFPLRRAVRVVLPDDEVAVWKVDDRYHAVSAICRHHHVPTLHEGMREGLEVMCPLHGWTYSIATGEATRGGGKLQVYPTLVKDGAVWITVPDGSDV
jgi:nitrite reductase (NADH) small subunit